MPIAGGVNTVKNHPFVPIEETNLRSRRTAVDTESEKLTGFSTLCQRCCDDQWVGDHLSAEQAAESVLDQFKRMIDRDLALLEIRCVGTEQSKVPKIRLDYLRTLPHANAQDTNSPML
jgi:hypothetical protein